MNCQLRGAVSTCLQILRQVRATKIHVLNSLSSSCVHISKICPHDLWWVNDSMTCKRHTISTAYQCSLNISNGKRFLWIVRQGFKWMTEQESPLEARFKIANGPIASGMAPPASGAL